MSQSILSLKSLLFRKYSFGFDAAICWFCMVRWNNYLLLRAMYVLPLLPLQQNGFLISNDSSLKEKIFAYILQAEKFLPYLAVAYLALLACISIKWIKAYQYTQHVRTEGLQKIEVDWRLFVQKLVMQLGIKQKVSIFLFRKSHNSPYYRFF